MANCQKAGFIETWGRGINKIRQGLKKMGLPEPTIENHVSGTLITIYRNVGVNGTNDTNNVGNMSETNLTERQRFILSSIKKNPLITGKEMSETCRKRTLLNVNGLSCLLSRKILSTSHRLAHSSSYPFHTYED